jgi:hypothetical protein
MEGPMAVPTGRRTARGLVVALILSAGLTAAGCGASGSPGASGGQTKQTHTMQSPKKGNQGGGCGTAMVDTGSLYA